MHRERCALHGLGYVARSPRGYRADVRSPRFERFVSPRRPSRQTSARSTARVPEWFKHTCASAPRGERLMRCPGTAGGRVIGRCRQIALLTRRGAVVGRLCGADPSRTWQDAVLAPSRTGDPARLREGVRAPERRALLHRRARRAQRVVRWSPTTTAPRVRRLVGQVRRGRRRDGGAGGASARSLTPLARSAGRVVARARRARGGARSRCTLPLLQTLSFLALPYPEAEIPSWPRRRRPLRARPARGKAS